VQRDRNVPILPLASCVRDCLAAASDKAFRAATAARAGDLACARPPAPPTHPRRSAARLPGARCPVLLGHSGVRLRRILRLRERGSIRGPAPFGAGNLSALRCSADLRGPRWTNPPSMAGCLVVPTVPLLLLGACHTRSDAYAMY